MKVKDFRFQGSNAYNINERTGERNSGLETTTPAQYSIFSSQNLRVLMVTPRFFPLVGGVENHVYQVAKRLAQDKIDVTVLTTDVSGQLPTSEKFEGIKVRRVRAWPANRDYYFAPDMYNVVKNGDWDIVHIQSYHTVVPPVAMIAALRASIPYVVTFHGGGHSSGLRNALRPIQWAMLQPLLVRAVRLITVAEFEIGLYGKALRVPAERFVLIPNGCDLPNVGKPAFLPKEGGPLIASVGRLERYKGHQRLIAALPYILQQKPDVRLWIAGTGPYEAELRRLAERLGVAQRVDIRAIPATEREMMAAELSKASLFVLLSEYETHPIAVLEALSLGCPALVTDSSGLSELSKRGLARSISLKSTAQEVASAVLGQLHQPLVPEHFDMPTWDDCAARLLDLYLMVMRRPRCAS